MSDTPRPPGKTTIAPNVLLTIISLTTLKTQGVHGFSAVPGGVDRLFSREYQQGIRIEIKEDTVFADLYVALQDNVNIRAVSREIQTNVKRAIEEMVGMNVGRINIHIEEIIYPQN
ncbi:MAG: hypothetical protein OHK0052_06110 [Anaerolineales bacterium]